MSPTKSTFFLGKNFGGTIHPCEKNEPTLDHSGGGVHGKACWLIAYYTEGRLDRYRIGIPRECPKSALNLGWAKDL